MRGEVSLHHQQVAGFLVARSAGLELRPSLFVARPALKDRSDESVVTTPSCWADPLEVGRARATSTGGISGKFSQENGLASNREPSSIFVKEGSSMPFTAKPADMSR